MEDIDAALCPCGCGYPAEVAHDSNLAGRVMVTSETCQVRSAVQSWMKSAKPGPDQVVITRLLAEGESMEDATHSEYEVLRARLGLDGPVSDSTDDPGDQGDGSGKGGDGKSPPAEEGDRDETDQHH